MTDASPDRRPSARLLLCTRACVGYLLTLPVVCVVGCMMLLTVMGDMPRGVPRPQWERPVLLAGAALLVIMQGLVAAAALWSLRGRDPHAAEFRAGVVGSAAAVAWVVGVYGSLAVAVIIPTWVWFAQLPVVLAGPILCAVGGTYVGSLVRRGGIHNDARAA